MINTPRGSRANMRAPLQTIIPSVPHVIYCIHFKFALCTDSRTYQSLILQRSITGSVYRSVLGLKLLEGRHHLNHTSLVCALKARRDYCKSTKVHP